MASDNHLRARTGQATSVTSAELFFDLIYAFAVTQLSHRLVQHLDVRGVLETLMLWFAVWLGWQYTCWVTNWFDPERAPVRVLLFTTMLLGLGAAIAIPDAFDGHAALFAVCYSAMQTGRSAVALAFLGRRHALTRNYQRILSWTAIAAVFWIAGIWAAPSLRLILWSVAVACEYFSPMVGFAIPGLGRSRASDWQSADGQHIAERCESFVIIALGESLLATGGTFSEIHPWTVPVIIALLVGFLNCVAMWWLYFDTTSHAASRMIRQSDAPGAVAAYYHYVHVILIAGIIAIAAGDALAITHPALRNDLISAFVFSGGPFLFLLGSLLYKWIIHRIPPLSHLCGLVALIGIGVGSLLTDHLMASGLTTIVFIVVAGWEAVSRQSERNTFLRSE
jgi:low temperature requirement protein LtrA